MVGVGPDSSACAVEHGPLDLGRDREDKASWRQTGLVVHRR